jgi:hypothetical protein
VVPVCNVGQWKVRNGSATPLVRLCKEYNRPRPQNRHGRYDRRALYRSDGARRESDNDSSRCQEERLMSQVTPQQNFSQLSQIYSDSRHLRCISGLAPTAMRLR